MDNHDVRARRHTALRKQLLRAEIAGTLSEFAAVSFQAILAILEGADGADDYLEMADAIAISARERAIVEAIRGNRDRLERSGVAKHARAEDEQAELWRRLLAALAG